MNSSTSRLPSPGLIVAIIALVAALAGTAIALPGKNKVDKNDIKKNAVKSKQVKDGSVTGIDVADNSITADDVDESGLVVSKVRGRLHATASVSATPAPVPYPLGEASTITQNADETLELFGRVNVTFPANCTGARAVQIQLMDPNSPFPVMSGLVNDPAGAGPSQQSGLMQGVPLLPAGIPPETAITRNLTAQVSGTCAAGGGNPVVTGVDIILHSIRG